MGIGSNQHKHQDIREAILAGPKATREFLQQNDQFLDELLFVAVDESGKSALVYAVEMGNPEVVEAILDGMNRLPPDDRQEILNNFGFNSSRKNVLHLAAERGDPTIVTQLANTGMEVDDTDLSGNRALFYAITNGHVEAVKALITAGADVNKSVNGDHMTPVQVAARTGHLEMVQTLIESGAEPLRGTPPALAYASSREVADFLIDDAKKHHFPIPPSVRLAAEARIGNAAKVKELLEKHPDVAADAFPMRTSGKLLLEDLIDRANPDVLNLLAVRKSDNVPDKTLFAILLDENVANGHVDKVKTIVQLGGKELLYKRSPLETPATNGDIAMANAIIEMRGAGFDNSNELALAAAVEAGQTEMVEFLTQKLGGKEFLMEHGGIALVTAANNGDIAMLETLVRHGGKDFVVQRGEYALRNAAENGDSKMVKALVETGGAEYVQKFVPSAIEAATKGGHHGVSDYLRRQQAGMEEQEREQRGPGKTGAGTNPSDLSPSVKKMASEAASGIAGTIALAGAAPVGTLLSGGEQVLGSPAKPAPPAFGRGAESGR
ncbi:MAG: ankyrin repeat domain-containing protein [Bacteroidales bacterium]|nr:ankyrin repeat domain-containing protein [Bacteroidales bacterium]